jgi:hypothetical protein
MFCVIYNNDHIIESRKMIFINTVDKMHLFRINVRNFQKIANLIRIYRIYNKLAMLGEIKTEHNFLYKKSNV